MTQYDQENDERLADAIDAAVFRRLVAHLQQRTDVQNIDLMGWGGFCRNCLGDWLSEAAAEPGVEIGKVEARARVHGMPQAEWKARHQGEATPEQLQRMAESGGRNKRD